MKRREFGKLTAGALAVAVKAVNAQSESVPTAYFVDGYHGGAIGHMPPGSWRDILNTLRDLPEWKICLDIEPISWDLLQRQDPLAYRELRAYFDNQPVQARLEMVGCTFAQPYGWAINGESNIRQLVRGREIIRRHFPKAVLATYAVQEPCWASCLPQILLSLGFSGAVLKDPGTAWGGYAAGFDAETVQWMGPDGSLITTVPRYACEGLQKVYETEAATVTPQYVRKCIEHGIRHPAGMYFQDLGWSAKPKVAADYIRYVTWREYLQTIADKPTKQWKFGIEDILTTLPWGEKTLQAVAQQVRSAENRILIAEKMAAMAWMESHAPWPKSQLEEAWDPLLYAQAHDAWITATTRMGRQAWAFQVASGTQHTEDNAAAIIAASVRDLSTKPASSTEQRLGNQWVRVINTLGSSRTDLCELMLSTDRGTRGIRLFDSSGKEVPVQVTETRKYLTLLDRAELSRKAQVSATPGNQTGSAGINAATVLFRAQTPALGYANYRVEPVYDRDVPRSLGDTSARAEGGNVVLESDLYRLRLDGKQGGAITSLLAKEFGKEFCDQSSERKFNEYRGYFISEKQWHSSTENVARFNILENGPLRARVRIIGKVGTVPYQTTLTLVSGQRRIECQTRFTYSEDTWIGDPWDIRPEDRRSERRRSQNDGRWKLQAFFPVSFKPQSIYKNAAYDVCRSRNQNTFFQGWDEIKHNMIVNWVDAFDEEQKLGLAVFSDHTTAYTHGPEHPLALVAGWGWEGGFWWGKCPLRGVQQINYGIQPHRGLWDQARLWEENARWQEPLLTQIVDGGLQGKTEPQTLIRVSGTGVEVPTLLVEGRSLLIRLFNAEGGEETRTVSLRNEPVRVEMVELDGRTTRQLDVQKSAEGRYECSFPLPRFAIRTLRCEFSEPPKA